MGAALVVCLLMMAMGNGGADAAMEAGAWCILAEVLSVGVSGYLIAQRVSGNTSRTVRLALIGILLLYFIAAGFNILLARVTTGGIDSGAIDGNVALFPYVMVAGLAGVGIASGGSGRAKRRHIPEKQAGAKEDGDDSDQD